MSGARFGIEGKLYYCAAGIGGTPSWTLFKTVKNVTNPNTLKEVDVTTRANAGYVAQDGRLKDASIQFDMPFDPTDANYQAFESAWVNNSIIGVACMCGSASDNDSTPTMGTGSRGLWADCKVTDFSRDENIDGVMTIKVTAKPTYSANAPSWHVV